MTPFRTYTQVVSATTEPLSVSRRRTANVAVIALVLAALVGVFSSQASALVVTPPGQTNLTLPETTVQGGVWSASTGTWSAPTHGVAWYTFQWQVSRPGANGPWANATGIGNDTATYVALSSDVGTYLRVVVAADDGTGVTRAYSESALVEAPPAPTNLALPVVTLNGGAVNAGPSGTVWVASSGTWSAPTNGVMAYTYQWVLSQSGDAGTWVNATGPGSQTATYVSQPDDVGKYLRVSVSASDGAGTTTVASASTLVGAWPTPNVPIVLPPLELPKPTRGTSLAPGITPGSTRAEVRLTPATRATSADLLRGANIWVQPTAKVEFLDDALPAGLKLVDGKLMASEPGTYKVKMKIKRKNGTSVVRTIKIKVG
jgi:hypothetical protein